MKIKTINKCLCYVSGGDGIKKTSRKITKTQQQISKDWNNKFYKSLPTVKSKQKPINQAFLNHCKKFK